MSIVAGAEADVASLTAQAACRNVMHAYADLVDSGNASQVSDLFTDDAAFDSGGGRTVSGRANLAKVFAAREANTARRTRHLIVNPVVDLCDEGIATGHSSILLFVLDGANAPGAASAVAPNAVVNCHDRFARGDDGCWRIADRRLELLAGSV